MITDVKINEALKKLYYERGYWGDKTIADVWDKQCEKYGDRTYVQDDLGTKLTYRQVDDRRTQARIVAEGSRRAKWRRRFLSSAQMGRFLHYLSGLP